MTYRTWSESWDESWGDSWGIGLADAGIGLAPQPVARPIDFVVSNDDFVLGISRVVKPAPVYKPDRSEMEEMMQMYAMWRKAA